MKAKTLNLIVDDSYRGYHFEIGRFDIYEDCKNVFYYVDTATNNHSVNYCNLLDVVKIIDNIQKGGD